MFSFQRKRFLLFTLLAIQLTTGCLDNSFLSTEIDRQRDSGAVAIRSSDTVVYTLKNGDTTDSVAKCYGITLSALKKINQFRVFAHDFENLRPGDELDVPRNIAGSDRKVFSEKIEVDSRQEESTDLAGLVSQTAEFLANKPNSQAAFSMAENVVTGQVNQTLQRWLSPLGTISVDLDLDNEFSLKNSAFSLLYPWYNQPDNVIFSQSVVHRTEDRTQFSQGIGFRHFMESDMMGINLFFDHDLSRDHSRLGFGGEYGRDYLKFAANSYLRLSNWKSSPDVKDYDERPANGWDIRAEGWLPSYPQFGTKLAYEQYYGHAVALFGKNQRQRNPHALVVGISYTPFPLLTISAEQHQGKNGKNETDFLVSLSYRLGESLAKQFDPYLVAAERTLSGSRFDLVSRNNNIVLEYRKQKVITLNIPAQMEGRSGETLKVNVSVQAKHGLKYIEWDESALLLAEGKLTGQGTDWQLLVPKWKKEGEVIQVSAVAHDTKNNVSEKVTMNILVKKPNIQSILKA
ncbi:inverse autotransporter beta domain-containing protein, partial [Salmonella enterica]|nr:inverse autotransporter beta domain-containing protein [Salmonella enterica]EJR3519512.1 inverse autotransporter beta domain-containing protein [Salmonella enterica]